MRSWLYYISVVIAFIIIGIMLIPDKTFKQRQLEFKRDSIKRVHDNWRKEREVLREIESMESQMRVESLIKSTDIYLKERTES